MRNWSIYLLAIGTFLTGSAEMVISGILNLITKDLQITIALAGQMVTAFSLAFAIGTPVIVTLTSRIERKKILLGSLGMFIFGNLISYFSDTFPILLLIRVIIGASAGVFIVVAMSVASRLVAKEKIGNAISTVSLGFGMALVLGVPLGVMLSEWLGWKSIFLAIAIISIFIMVALARTLPTLEGEQSIPIVKQFSILKNGKILSGLLSIFFLIAGYGSSYTYLAAFLQENLHLNMSMISVSMLIFGIFATAGTRIGGYGADKWGTEKTIFYSIFMHIIFLILLPLFTSSLFATLVIATVWISLANATIPAIQTYFIQQSPQSTELALSASSSMAQIGLAVGAALGGILVNISATSSYNPWLSALFVLLSLGTASISISVRPKAISE